MPTPHSDDGERPSSVPSHIEDTDAPVVSPTPIPADGVVPGSTKLPAGVIRRRLVEWDPNGNPIVVTVPMMTKTQVRDIPLAAISAPYTGPEEEYKDMTIAEVMIDRVAKRAAADGNLEDIEMLLDQAVGKPKQTTESFKITATYEDFLKDVEKKTTPVPPTPAPPWPVEIIEAAKVVDDEGDKGDIFD